MRLNADFLGGATATSQLHFGKTRKAVNFLDGKLNATNAKKEPVEEEDEPVEEPVYRDIGDMFTMDWVKRRYVVDEDGQLSYHVGKIDNKNKTFNFTTRFFN